MTFTRMIARTAGALAVSCLSTAALADPGLTVYAGEDGAVEADRVCDVYIAGVATHGREGPLRYRWLDGAAALTPWSDVRADGTAPVELCGLSPGRHALTLEVTDGETTASDTLLATIGEAGPGLVAATPPITPQSR